MFWVGLHHLHHRVDDNAPPGHYHFTRLLLPCLIAGTKSSGDGKARIVNLASSSHLLTNCLWWDTFEDGPARRSKSRTELYNQSKFVGFVTLIHLQTCS